ncbi:uncharacterized protein LOC129944890 [Eupeodes corollae]|uniref:uncharacterized protein LOC129944890 n=1 Tax=Eupeodes corollae TaxID=290404 RepID=UPI0024910C32|nr:uncharacterized protein LOC129944890 [Eupeodes corollae]
MDKSINLQKFNGRDYSLWKFQVLVYLRAHDLDCVLDESIKPTEELALAAWIQKGKKAQLIITSSMDFNQLKFLVTSDSAAKMWTKLSFIYEQKSGVSLSTLQQKFYEYRKSEDDNMASHISDIEQMAKQLEELGAPMAESAIITKIICSLPSQFKHFISAWDSVAQSEQTFQNLSQRLMKEEMLLFEKPSDDSATDHQALIHYNKKKTSIADKKKNSTWALVGRMSHPTCTTKRQQTRYIIGVNGSLLMVH